MTLALALDSLTHTQLETHWQRKEHVDTHERNLLVRNSALAVSTRTRSYTKFKLEVAADASGILTLRVERLASPKLELDSDSTVT